jgi:hypothetical protein
MDDERIAELHDQDKLIYQSEASKILEMFIILLIIAFVAAWLLPGFATIIWRTFWIFTAIWFAALIIGHIKS